MRWLARRTRVTRARTPARAQRERRLRTVAVSLGCLNALVLAAAIPLSRAAPLPDLLVDLGGGGRYRQALGNIWVSVSGLVFSASEPVQITDIAFGSVDPEVAAGRPVLWPATENGDAEPRGICGPPNRAGYYGIAAEGATLTVGEVYRLAIPIRPRGDTDARSGGDVSQITVAYRLGDRTGEQTFERAASLEPRGGRAPDRRCSPHLRSIWIYRNLRPPLTQARVHALWTFVARYVAQCPEVRTTAAEDPRGRKLLGRIERREC